MREVDVAQRDRTPDLLDAPALASASARLVLDPGGGVRLDDGSGDIAAHAGRILLAVHDAQLTGAWQRMKLCRNPECEVAFWDSSRNTSGVWHDVRTCGNVANLRKSRARRAARAAE
ncbi:CGNR zinc finger domain-containing protein [Paractinoplanes deccanensis]|uniref:CGNR zinc finger domain-containing protein n=1 Tax=Paractinoplanes deccanensis TaxID=113561 RepID=UPI001EF38F14|nr:CGNR zinc finger domain-containing protein [Actinoplanes deccanensis]